jgi:hypothetical protein
MQADWQNGSRKKMVMQEEAHREKQATKTDNKLQPFQITVIFLGQAATLFHAEPFILYIGQAARDGREVFFHILVSRTGFILLIIDNESGCLRIFPQRNVGRFWKNTTVHASMPDNRTVPVLQRLRTGRDKACAVELRFFFDPAEFFRRISRQSS